MRVLLTRAANASARSASVLKGVGHQALVMPLVRVVDLGKPVPPGHFDATAFTSAAAVEIITQRISANRQLAQITALPAFCVGAATAEAARMAGFSQVHTGTGNAANLVELLAASQPANTTRPKLLHVAPRHRAFDLAAALPHWHVMQMLAYEAQLVDPGRAAFRAALDQCEAALLYSSRSAAHLWDLARRHECTARFECLTLIAISEQTAQAIASQAKLPVHIAATPDEAAMIRLLDKKQAGLEA